MNKKLLQINTTGNFNATGRIAEDIGVIAQRNGYESYIALGRSKRQSANELITIGNKVDIFSHVALTRLFDAHGLGSKQATLEFVKKLSKLNPTIVHLHNLHGYYLNYRFLFQYLNNTDIPCVWTFHDCWPITGHCAHFMSVECDKWERGCHDCELKNEYPKSLLIDASTRNYELKRKYFGGKDKLLIVAVSYWLKDILQRSFLKDKEIEVIHNGIDLDIFTPIDLRTRAKLRSDNQIPNDKFVILGVASQWNEHKGFLDFIELSKYLPANCQIVMVGLTKEQISRLPNSILGVPRISDIHVLRSFYCMADLFLNLSYQESLPTVNIEALACGIPVIAYDAGGTRETLPCDSSLIVKIGDLGAVVKAIVFMMQRDKNESSREGRLFVEENFDKGKQYLKYIEVYNRLISYA